MAPTIRKSGKMIEIKMKAPIILDERPRNVRKESASTLSIVSISLENRFMIRPSGVVAEGDFRLEFAPVAIGGLECWT